MAERIVVRTRTPAAPAAPVELALPVVQVESIARELGEPSWWTDGREAARQAFLQRPMPTTAEERWRRTDLDGLRLGSLELGVLAWAGKQKKLPAALKNAFGSSGLAGQCVFESKEITIRLEDSLRERGVILAPLWKAAKEHPDLVRRHAGTLIDPTLNKFDALAAAVADAGFFFYVPRGVRIETPIHVLIWTDAEWLRAWRSITVLEEGAAADLIVEYASPDGKDHAVRAGVHEQFVGAGSSLRMMELQSWGSSIWAYARGKARVEAGGTLEWSTAQIGSAAGKCILEADLAGEGAKASIHGLYGASGRQILDCETYQNHLVPHTNSDLLFKGALWGESRAVWRGMIYIAEGARGADGYQINRNLLLSDRAKADSLPGLEILTDDVRCTHGATVGQLDADELYYAQTRGIPAAEAEEMLVAGFFEPVLAKIPLESVQKRMRLAIQAKSGTMEEKPA